MAIKNRTRTPKTEGFSQPNFNVCWPPFSAGIKIVAADQ